MDQDNKKLHMVLYARVSTEGQTTENQILSLKKYAEMKDYDYTIFEETMSSRKTRPIKQIVLHALRQKKFDGVIIYKLDRWARSSKELLLEIEELHHKGLKFISITENFDLDSSIGRLQFQILSGFAQFERDLIRERTIEGLNRARFKGQKLGRPPGSKDKKKRKNTNYLIKEALKRQEAEIVNKGVFRSIEEHLRPKIKNKNYSPIEPQ